MFYEHMKAVCKEKHTSPSAVCLALGMSKSNVTNWKNGGWPRLGVVMDMAKVLDGNYQDRQQGTPEHSGQSSQGQQGKARDIYTMIKDGVFDE